jgi:hypothetical protein
VKQSKCKYLLTTNYNDNLVNKDIKNTDYFSINLFETPFSWPKESIVEIFDEETRFISKEPNKYLVLIDLEKLRTV